MSNGFKSKPVGQFLSRHRALLLLLGTILLVIFVRVRLRDMPLERDEGEYAYAGQLILQGVPPYKEVYNMKLPGTYAAYAGIMAVFGETPSGIHLGVMLVNIASIALVFALGRKLLDDAAGAVAALIFALFSLTPSVLGLAGHATHFVTLFALAGTWVLLILEDGPKAKAEKLKTEMLKAGPFLAGLLFGLAFLMKQHGVFFGIFGFLYLLWLCLEPRFQKNLRFEISDLKSRQSRGSPGRKSAPSTLNYPSSVALAKEDQPSTAAKRLTQIAADKLKLKSPDPQFPIPDLKSQIPGPPASPISNLKSEDSNPSGLEPAPISDLRSQISNPSPPARPASHLPSPIFALATYAAGFLLPYLLTCLVLWAAGVFPQFWFWTVDYAWGYASNLSLFTGERLFKSSLRTVIGPNFLLWLLPCAGALLMWWDDRLSAGRRFFLVLFFFCSVGSISVGLYFREHYFITLLPVLALLGAVAVSRSLHVLQHVRTLETFLAIPVVLLAISGIGAALIGNGSVWFGLTPAEAMDETCSSTLFSESRQVADYLRNHAPSNSRIAVLGSEPQIFFESRRRSVSGHIYMYPLMEPTPSSRQMQERFISDIERARPEYVVYVGDSSSWIERGELKGRMMDWWKGYQNGNLELEKSYSIRGITEEIGSRPGADNVNGVALTKFLYVFRRKS